MKKPIYSVSRAGCRPELLGMWDGPAWRSAPSLAVACFRPEGSAHRPVTRVKLVYDRNGIYGLFQVKDTYVRCVRTRFQDAVYKDSCVEFFVQPKPAGGYFNFEFNCGGALLASYITDPARVPGGFKNFVRLTDKDARRLRIHHSLPAVVEPEAAQATTWHLEFFIPFALLEAYVGPIAIAKNAPWRANFYKCADETSHPHWGAWSPVDELNFHLPRCFGTLVFEV
ncbi:MAG: carbohydrate-binding family 9-like protein [Desulfobacterales bacterium]